MNKITINEFSLLTGRNYKSAERWVNRKGISREYTATEKGRVALLSVEDLIKKGGLSIEQQEKILTSKQIKIEPSEGNRLLASSAVRKQFNNLSPAESELLSKIPGWESMTRSRIVETLSKSLGVSRAWLYRDHTTDRRKVKVRGIETLSPEQLSIVQGLLLKCRMKKSFVTECLNNTQLPDLSPRTWYRINADLSVCMTNEVAFIKDGPLKMRSRISPIERDKTFLNPLDAIVGDFWRVDFATKWVDGSLVRPSCAVWVDWRTYKIVGVALTRFPNSLGVKTSLFDCFVRYGVPFNAIIDNGKEYVAHRIVGKKCEESLVRLDYADAEDKLKIFEAKGFLPSMTINSKRALKRNPTTKIVERLFGRGGFTDWAKEFSNWIGSNYWETPEAVARASRKYKQGDEREFFDGRTGEVIRFMDLDELASAIQMFVHRHNERISSGFGMDKQSPNMLWERLTKDHPPRRAPIEKIAFHFMEGKALKVRGSGFIEFKKHFSFTSDSLLRMSGRNVHIRWNPIDGFWWNRADEKQFEFLPNSIYVYDENGEYLTTATFVQKNHPLSADVSALMKKKMSVIKEAQENVNMLLGPKPTIVDVKSAPDDVVKAAEKKRLEEKKDEDPLEGNRYKGTFI